MKRTGHYSEKTLNALYTEKDIRFTQKGNTLYAIVLGIPKGEVVIRSLGTCERLFEGDILSIELLGNNEKISFEHNALDVTLQMPENFEGEYACVFRIERKG